MRTLSLVYFDGYSVPGIIYLPFVRTNLYSGLRSSKMAFSACRIKKLAWWRQDFSAWHENWVFSWSSVMEPQPAPILGPSILAEKIQEGAVSRISFFPPCTLAAFTFDVSGASCICESYCPHDCWCWWVTCTPAVCGAAWGMGEAWKACFHKVTTWLHSWVQCKCVAYIWYCHSGPLSKWLFLPKSCICLGEGGEDAFQKKICVFYREMYIYI